MVKKTNMKYLTDFQQFYLHNIPELKGGKAAVISVVRKYLGESLFGFLSMKF